MLYFNLTRGGSGSSSGGGATKLGLSIPAGGFPWKAIRSGNGYFLAVGNTNKFGISNNAISWTEITLPGTMVYYDTTYGNGLYVAVGGSDSIVTSPDGLTWTQRRTGTGTIIWKKVVSNGTYLLALGEASGFNYFGKSSDGITWSVSSLSAGSSTYYQTLAWNGSFWCAVGYNYAAKSTDGVSWTTSYFSGFNGYEIDLISDGTKFYTVNPTSNGTYYSSTGTSWSYAAVAANVSGMNYSSGKYTAVTQDGYVYSSTTGTSWSLAAYLPEKGNAPAGGTSQWLGLAYNNGNYATIVSSTNFISTSSDGTTWVGQKLPYFNWNSVAYGNNLYVASPGTATSPYLYTSTDGLRWVPVSVGWKVWESVIWDGSRFVVVGDDTLIHSTDGVTWTTVTLPISSAYRVAGSSTASKWVVFDDYTGQYTFSSDLVTWSTPTAFATSTAPKDIIWTGSQFLATGSTTGPVDCVITSSNGTTWTKTNLTSNANLTVLGYSGTLYIVFSSSKTTAYKTSTNGTTWTNRTMPGSYIWSDVAWTGSKFIAVGYDSTAAVYATSTDGISWSMNSLNVQSPGYSCSVTTKGSLAFVICGASNNTTFINT